MTTLPGGGIHFVVVWRRIDANTASTRRSSSASSPRGTSVVVGYARLYEAGDKRAANTR